MYFKISIEYSLHVLIIGIYNGLFRVSLMLCLINFKLDPCVFFIFLAK